MNETLTLAIRLLQESGFQIVAVDIAAETLTVRPRPVREVKPWSGTAGGRT